MFRSRPVAVGAFVLTKAAPSSRVENACAKLCKMSVWVCCTYTDLETLCRRTHHASCAGMLHHTSATCTLLPQARVGLLAVCNPFGTFKLRRPSSRPEEHRGPRGTSETLSAAPSADHLGPQMHVHFTGLLRLEEVLGGGFLLTSARHVPGIVRDFIAQIR